MSDSNVYLSSAKSTESYDTSYSSRREEMAGYEYGSTLRRRTPLCWAKISTKIDKDGFLPAVFRSRLEQKIPFA